MCDGIEALSLASDSRELYGLQGKWAGELPTEERVGPGGDMALESMAVWERAWAIVFASELNGEPPTMETLKLPSTITPSRLPPQLTKDPSNNSIASHDLNSAGHACERGLWGPEEGSTEANPHKVGHRSSLKTTPLSHLSLPAPESHMVFAAIASLPDASATHCLHHCGHGALPLKEEEVTSGQPAVEYFA